MPFTRTMEAMVSAWDAERLERLGEQGIPGPAGLTKDAMRSPNYEAGDPFYSGPQFSELGNQVMRFADVARPDLGEGLPV
jgi:hypothetical protein